MTPTVSASTTGARYFDIEQAKQWDLPSQRVPIGVAVSGQSSCRLAGRNADIMVAVEPKAELVEMFDEAGGRDTPNPESFQAATQFVRPEDVAGALSRGPEVDEHVEKIKPFIDAGFDEVALVQIGAGHQDAFIAWAESELLPALRSL